MSYDGYQNLRIDVSDSIARVILDSTSNQNSLNRELPVEFRDVLIDLCADDDIRCIVLTGSRGAFCLGADLTLFEAGETDSKRCRRLATLVHNCVDIVHQAEKPVIVGVNGVAAGGWFGLALSGDLVIMREDARLNFVYPRIGQAADGRSTFLLPRYVGLRRAKEIALLDKPISAEEALELGLVTETVPSDEFNDRLDELAETLASGPTRAYGEVKTLMLESFENGLREQMAAETVSVSRLASTEDWKEGISSFVNGEKPDFSGE